MKKIASAFVLWIVAVQFAFAIDVDLTTFPDSGNPVPDSTVLSDQWRSIGILFDASPASVDPVKESFGGSGASLFFDPDQAGVDAIFEFVEPGTANAVSIAQFTIRPFFDPGESAQLVGLDGGDNIVAIQEVTSSDIGISSRTITMTISGTFETVEWRTQGNPGISAEDISFEFELASEAEVVPALPTYGLVLLVVMFLALAGMRLKRV
ncbi:MAG: hypothetical protein AAF098_15080 [Pseudomonadota bacterium]